MRKLWVGNLIYENKLKEYYWLNNLNSEHLNEDSFASQLVDRKKIVYIADDHLDIPEEIEYDIIFVCLSAEYLRDEFGPCDTWKGIYQTYFDYCYSLYIDKTFKT